MAKIERAWVVFMKQINRNSNIKKENMLITPVIGMNSWMCRYCLAKVAFLQRRCNECGYGIRWS